MADLKARREQVTVPPGHISVFVENLVHEVVKRRRTDVMVRLFTAWRLSRSAEHLHHDLLERLRLGSVIKLKSDQTPRMVSKVFWMYAAMFERVKAFSKFAFKPQVLITIRKPEPAKT